MIDNEAIAKSRRLRAHRLRHATNDAEKRLWRCLRKVPLQGTHFRRQVPIGPYVADFACMARRLLVELDGSQHGKEANKSRDEARTRWLERQGFRVVRVWNNEIVENINGVLERIYAEIYGSLNVTSFPLKHSHRKRARPLPPVEKGSGC